MGTAAPGGTVTILFSDICGFTSLCERLGDRVASDVLRAHNQVVRSQVADHGGFEVKSQGDGFMVAFDSASKAVRCAMGIQRSMARWSDQNPDSAIRLHIGVHTGEAVSDGTDFHGRAVILASRIAAHAGPDQILVSGLVRELTGPSREFTFGADQDVALKGIAEMQRVTPVMWERAS